MPLIDRPDRGGDPSLQVPDRLVFGLVAAMTLARRRKAPVRFVDQVVAANPRLVLVARGEPGPQRDGLALILRALPQPRLGGVAVGDGEGVGLAAGRGVEVQNSIVMVRPDPGQQPGDAVKACVQTCILAGAGQDWSKYGQGSRVRRRRIT